MPSNSWQSFQIIISCFITSTLHAAALNIASGFSHLIAPLELDIWNDPLDHSTKIYYHSSFFTYTRSFLSMLQDFDSTKYQIDNDCSGLLITIMFCEKILSFLVIKNYVSGNKDSLHLFSSFVPLFQDFYASENHP